jgi:hypothetical protein
MSRAYEKLAELHRPTDQAGIEAAARGLAAQGLKTHDIASTLQIGVTAVVQALRDTARLGL